MVSFHGLGAAIRQGGTELDLALAEKNILVVFPYYGPWSWMNRLSRQFVDELLERVWKDLALPEDLPLFSSGGSMGGCAALLYCRYGKRVPVAAAGRTWDRFTSAVHELARAIGKDDGYVSRIIRVTLLSPEIIHAIIAGTLEKDIGIEQLKQAMPLMWDEQKKMFGME